MPDPTRVGIFLFMTFSFGAAFSCELFGAATMARALRRAFIAGAGPAADDVDPSGYAGGRRETATTGREGATELPRSDPPAARSRDRPRGSMRKGPEARNRTAEAGRQVLVLATGSRATGARVPRRTTSPC